MNHRSIVALMATLGLLNAIAAAQPISAPKRLGRSLQPLNQPAAAPADAPAEVLPQSYHGQKAAYSIAIPDGWVQVPDNVVQQTTRMMFTAEARDKIKVDAVFQRKGRPWFDYPYVMVQVIQYPSGEPSEWQIKREIKNMTGIDVKEAEKHTAPQVRNLLTGLSSDKPSYDSSTKTFTMSMRSDVVGIGRVNGVLYGNFGHDALVTVNCYTKASDPRSADAEFQQFVGSFKFDPGAGYQGGNSFFSGIPSWPVLGGIIGAVVGILIYLSRRKKQA